MSSRMCIVLVIGCVAVSLLCAHAVHAQSTLGAQRMQIDTSEIPQAHRSWWQVLLSYVGLKSNSRSAIPVGTKLRVISSAYAPSKYQTDDTPCITAAGTTVRPGVVAANFLPLGTIIAIDNVKYIVEDRMNSRFKGYFIDVWLPSTSEALDFGRQKLEITIVAYGKPGDMLVSPTPTPSKILQQITELEQESIWNTIGNSAVLIGRLLVSKVDPNRYDVTCSQ